MFKGVHTTLWWTQEQTSIDQSLVQNDALGAAHRVGIRCAHKDRDIHDIQKDSTVAAVSPCPTQHWTNWPTFSVLLGEICADGSCDRGTVMVWALLYIQGRSGSGVIGISAATGELRGNGVVCPSLSLGSPFWGFPSEQSRNCLWTSESNGQLFQPNVALFYWYLCIITERIYWVMQVWKRNDPVVAYKELTIIRWPVTWGTRKH